MIGGLIKALQNRADGWISALTGYGVPGRDKRTAVGHQATLLSDASITDLWRGNDIAARIIEVIPHECFRQGFEVNAGDKELTEDVSSALEELNVLPIFLDAKKYERAYGGAAIYPVINDGQADLIQPLNMDRISKIDHLIKFEPRELQAQTWYESPADKLFGEPKTYLVNPIIRGGASAIQQYEIHESRLIIFPGIRTSRAQVSINQAWGDSVIFRAWEVMRDYGIAWSSVAVLLHEFSLAQFKIKGLAELIASDRDDVIKARLRAIQLSQSTINATMMDADESFERHQTPVAGMSDLINSFATRLAAAADMPVTLLMGQAPAGLNATGASDVRFFYDRVASHQRFGCTPQLERLLTLYFLSKAGVTKGKEPKNWSLTFNPLWQPSEKERADTRKVIADTDAVYISNQVLSPEDVAISRFGGDTYSAETVVDFEERAKLQAEQEKEQEEQKQLEAQKVKLLSEKSNNENEDPVGELEDISADDDEIDDENDEDDEDKQDEYRTDFIENRNEEWVVISHDTNQVVASFSTEHDARVWLEKKQNRQYRIMLQGRHPDKKYFENQEQTLKRKDGGPGSGPQGGGGSKSSSKSSKSGKSSKEESKKSSSFLTELRQSAGYKELKASQEKAKSKEKEKIEKVKIAAPKEQPKEESKEHEKSIDPANLKDLASVATTAASEIPEGNGRYGNQKVFISAVYDKLKDSSLKGVSLEKFKEQLYKAHQEGLITLHRADLVYQPEMTERSEIKFHGATVHYFEDKTKRS